LCLSCPWFCWPLSWFRMCPSPSFPYILSADSCGGVKNPSSCL
jgi:hypothetical protein